MVILSYRMGFSGLCNVAVGAFLKLTRRVGQFGPLSQGVCAYPSEHSGSYWSGAGRGAYKLGLLDDYPQLKLKLSPPPQPINFSHTEILRLFQCEVSPYGGCRGLMYTNLRVSLLALVFAILGKQQVSRNGRFDYSFKCFRFPSLSSPAVFTIRLAHQHLCYLRRSPLLFLESSSISGFWLLE